MASPAVRGVRARIQDPNLISGSWPKLGQMTWRFLYKLWKFLQECKSNPLKRMTKCPDVKESFGSSPSHSEKKATAETPLPVVPSLPVSVGLKGRKRRERTQATSIGNLLSPCVTKGASGPSSEFLDAVNSMESYQEVKQRMLTCAKKTQEWVSLLSGVRSLSDGTVRLIGNESGNLQSWETSTPSPRMCVWVLTAPSVPLRQTFQYLSVWKESALCTGEVQVRESLVELGKKREIALTVSVPGQNFGMATKINRLLSSMNFEEVISKGSTLRY